MDFVSLYNAGSGYGYPWSPSSLATTTYSARYYNYDALGNFATKGASKYIYAQTGDANPDAVIQIANGLSTTYAYDKNGNLSSAVGPPRSVRVGTNVSALNGPDGVPSTISLM
jgi:hypothetical protein